MKTLERSKTVGKEGAITAPSKNTSAKVPASKSIKPDVGEQIKHSVKPAPDYVVTADTLLKNGITEIPYLVSPMFQKVGIAGLVGSSDTGKSTFLRQFAMAIASGEKEFIGYPLQSEHKSVIYVSSEDDEYAISSLLKKQKFDGSDDDAYKGLRFIFNTENLFEKIQDELERQPADCVIIDAFTDICDKEIFRANAVRSFLNEYADVAKKHKCLIIFLHHTKKSSEGLAPSKNNAVGSQGFESRMRVLMEFLPDPEDKHIRHLCIVKGNYVPPEEKESSIVLEFDDTLIMKRLDKRVPFEELGSKKKNDVKNAEMVAEAIKHSEDGKPIREIADILSKGERSVSKSTVANWVKAYKGKPEDVSTVQKP